MTTVFYHKADLDGKASAAFIAKALYKRGDLSRTKFVGVDYDCQPDHTTIDGPVIMVDFALQPFDNIVELAKILDRQNFGFLWIDHHASAIREYIKIGATKQLLITPILDFVSTLPGVTPQKRLAACELTALYFDQKEFYALARLLGRYDVGDDSSGWEEYVLPFQMGVESLSIRFSLPDWWHFGSEVGRILGNDKSIIDASVEDIFNHAAYGRSIIDVTLDMGRKRLEERAQWAKEVMKNAYETELYGLRLIAVKSVPGLNSRDFASVYDPERHDAMAYAYQGKDGNGIWTVILYTDKEDIDLSTICKAYGGGGHKNAAGFQCQILPI